MKTEVAYGIPTIFSAIGTLITFWLGGWDMLIQILVFFVILDYATGVLSGIKNKNLSSDVMYWGGIRKGITLVVIMIAVMFDTMLNNSEPVFRTIALYFYIGREGLSIIENMGKLGVPLPAFIKSTINQIAKRGGK
jgi:toxin secretion/phage lysis holin